MNYKNRIAQLYKIVCRVNGWEYWGMIYKEGKTHFDRFEEHKEGKGGIHLYKGILEYGEDNFYVELVETGRFEYIRQREIEESKHTLYAQNKGWNGNSGYAIFNDEETIKSIIEKRKLVEPERVKKFKISYGELDQTSIRKKTRKTIESKSEQEIKLWRESIPNSWRGQTKHTNNKLKKQSETLKEKWKNPSDSMLEGIKKSAEWKIGKNKENWDVMKRHSELMKIKTKGQNNPMFKHFYITPLGKFETYQEAAAAHGSGSISGIQRLCKNPKTIITRTIIKFSNLTPDLIGKTAQEAGFGLEYI